MIQVGAAEFGKGSEIIVDVFGLGIDRLIRHLRAEAFDALVVFDRPAVLAISIHLIPNKKRPDVRFDGQRADAFADGIIAVLRPSNFGIAIADEIGRHRAEGSARPIEAVIESRGEQSGFETVAPEDGLLAKRDTLDREEFLGVGGPVTGYGVGFEIDDL
jgi:hypothetical protein